MRGHFFYFSRTVGLSKLVVVVSAAIRCLAKPAHCDNCTKPSSLLANSHRYDLVIRRQRVLLEAIIWDA